ncbi:uncharacterized protein LOC115877416 [Sitophilus oryzae]|uniref:Uncharacterized protein LOC115877416 n=1 Tax=Sitophilus oryzae TaxID=7048 RepID=A0A6J2XF95_SITOR|nr:uncharacterized protein LOC115877416 [Sitophilus oryzae]
MGQEEVVERNREISSQDQECQDQGNKKHAGDSCCTPGISTGIQSILCKDSTCTDEFKWTKQTTLLLLNLYKEKNYLFRNSKIKNKDIWLEILREFQERGYWSITIEILDRKMRNLKKTYKDNKDKKNKTGESCITWEYFDIMDEIFFNDKTINPTSTISTIEVAQNPNAVHSNLEVGLGVKILKNIENNSENNQKPTLPKTTEEKKINKGKTSSTRVKHLYDYRKKIQEIENQRLEEVKKLRGAIEQNNVIQQERNDILKRLLLNQSDS